MPFKIIRDDITKVKADAIVNTANPMPIIGSGTDGAIYAAAGSRRLLAARKKIGAIDRGQVAVTNAYRLKAKYIIHCVGPVWVDGNNNEFDTLRACYDNSLKKADELKCESIAFPLISTGVYGFPKDKALQIALASFSSFLTDHEMDIILVVYDTAAFQLSERIVGNVEAYIDANYVIEKQEYTPGRSMPYASRQEYSGSSSNISVAGETAKRSLDAGGTAESKPIAKLSSEFGSIFQNAHVREYAEPFVEEACLLSEETSEESSFRDKLFELIYKSGLDNKDVWKRSNLDRKHFSKIQCDDKYKPKKKTVFALCIGLGLDLPTSVDLLARADWAFNPTSKFDLIVRMAIEEGNYDMGELNAVLFKYTSETLGV